MLEEWGIKLTFIYAGEHKVEGNAYEPLSDEAREYFQTEINQIFGWFNTDIAKACDVTTKVVLDTFGQGRMFYGQAATKIGLANQVGTYDAVIGRLQGRKRTAVSASVVAAGSEVTCPDCNGSGLKPERAMGDPQGQEKCETCNGAGKAPKAQTQPAPVAADESDEGVEPDSNGNCAEGYEKRDGKCYPAKKDDETEATRAAARDAINLAAALSE
jgi:ClpP class serine protease